VVVHADARGNGADTFNRDGLCEPIQHSYSVLSSNLFLDVTLMSEMNQLWPHLSATRASVAASSSHPHQCGRT
jgi:hypothetical protein